MLSTQAAVVANRLGSVIDGKLVRTKISTPLGSMIAVADDAALFLLEFENRVALTGELRRLDRKLWTDRFREQHCFRNAHRSARRLFRRRVCRFPNPYDPAWYTVRRSRLAGLETDSSWADTQLW